MIAESLSEGLLDPEEHLRLTRALQIRNRVVNDVAVPLGAIRAVPVAAKGSEPTVAAIQRALAETGYSRFPVADLSGEFIGYLHIKDVLPRINDPGAVLDASMVRPLRGCTSRCRCPTRCRGCAATTATWPSSPSPIAA